MYKTFLVILFMILSINAYAFNVTCYMNDNEVFSGHVDDIYLENGYIALLDIKKSTVYFMLAECVITDKE